MALDSATSLLNSPILIRILLAVATKAVLLLGLSALLIAATRPSSAIRHLLRTLTLILVLVLPAIQLTFPPWQADLLPEQWQSGLRNATLSDSTTYPTAGSIESSPNTHGDGVTADPVVHQGNPSAASAPSLGTVLPLQSRQKLALQTPIAVQGGPWGRGDGFLRAYWGSLLLIGWFGGFLYLSGRLLLSLSCVRFAVSRSSEVTTGDWRVLFDRVLRRLDIDRPVRLLVSPRLEVALSVGIFRPAILLPQVAQTWSRERLESILLHELAHVKRWDNLSNVVSQWACTFHWYNPLVWWTARQLKVERERACDDQVLATGTLASEYVGHLLEVARAISSRRLWGHLEVSQSSALKDRLVAALNPNLDRQLPNLQLRMGAVVVSATLLFPIATFQPWLNNPESRPQVDPPLLGSVLKGGLSTGNSSLLESLTEREAAAQPAAHMESALGPKPPAPLPQISKASKTTEGEVPSKVDRRRFVPPQILSVERGTSSRASLGAKESARQRSLFGESRLAETRRALNGDRPALRFASPRSSSQVAQTQTLDEFVNNTDDLGPEPQPVYRVTVERIELGSLGIGESRATDINDSGVVVGQSQVASGLAHPFRWSQKSGIQDLGNPRGVHTRPVQINDRGQILCETFDSNLIMGFVWSEEAGLREIGALDPSFPVTAPRAMNGNGQVVGSSRGSDGALHAFRWTSSEGLQDLGLSGWSEAFAINDEGQIVGHADGRAFVWYPEDGVEYLLEDTVPVSVATDLNSSGVVVGYAEFLSGIPQAFYWSRHEGWFNLGSLNLKYPISLALGINDQSQVVGQSLSIEAPGGQRLARGFRWTLDGGMEDIGAALVDAPLAISAIGHIIGTYGQSTSDNQPLALWMGIDQIRLDSEADAFRESEVAAVNNKGQIVGSSLTGKRIRQAVLWDISLEPLEPPITREQQ